MYDKCPTLEIKYFSPKADVPLIKSDRIKQT